MFASSTSHPSLNLLFPIVLFHLVVIAVSNYLVQIPVTVAGFQTTWGAFTFPLIFLATDLTVRLYGSSQARMIIFTAMIPAILISYVLSVLFYNAEFQGFSRLLEINLFVARIAIASFLAYVFGQVLDIFVFSKLRQRKQWWVAPAFSSVIGTLIDTTIFFTIAFYKSSDEFMAANWVEIASVDYFFKLLISLVFFVPAYGIFMKIFIKKIASGTTNGLASQA